MESSPREKIIEVIKKLLSMAEHAGSNENEALVAAKRAEFLMRKYNVEYAEAIAAEIKTGASIVTRVTVATAKDNGTATKQTPPWAQQIAVRVGELFDTPVRLELVKTSKGIEMGIKFHGYTHDVDVAVWTYDVLIASINRVCKAYRKHPNYLRGGRTVMNAYRLGVVHSVLRTLAVMVADKEQDETAPSSTSTALVLVKRKAIEDKFGEFKYRKANAPSIKDSTAYHTGRVDGSKIAVQGAIDDAPEVKSLATGT